MSRSAPSGALKRALRVLRPRPARLRHAQAHGKASIETLTPIRCGGSSFGDKIGPSYSCGGQRDWGHAQASLREMVLFCAPQRVLHVGADRICFWPIVLLFRDSSIIFDMIHNVTIE